MGADMLEILGPMTAWMTHQDQPCITVYKASVLAHRSLVTLMEKCHKQRMFKANTKNAS